MRSDFFQLVEKAEGRLYWLDLDRLLHDAFDPLDPQRARALARFLAEAHATKRTSRRSTCVASASCSGTASASWASSTAIRIRGRPAAAGGVRGARVRAGALALAAARPRPSAVAHARRLPSLEHPVPRGDGLQRARSQPRRVGEPADDVAALGINYLFFGMRKAAQCGQPRRGRAVRYPVPRLPHHVHRGQPRPRHPGRCRHSSRSGPSCSRIPAGIRTCRAPVAHRPRPPGDVRWPRPRGSIRPTCPGSAERPDELGDLDHRRARLRQVHRDAQPRRAGWPSGARRSGCWSSTRSAGCSRRTPPTPTPSARSSTVRWYSWPSSLTKAGVPVIIDATAHRRAWRELRARRWRTSRRPSCSARWTWRWSESGRAPPAPHLAASTRVPTGPRPRCRA